MNDPLAERKALARTRLRAALEAVDDRPRRSAEIVARLLAWPRFRHAGMVMAYLPLAAEADITGAAAAVLGRGSRLFLPRVDWQTGVMTASEVWSLDAGLVTGRAGLREPPPGTAAVLASELDLILVPGLGFDAGGGRIGRGAGFYDRFLACIADPGGRAEAACGIGFDAQVAEEIPMGPMDIRLGAVATESRLILT